VEKEQQLPALRNFRCDFVQDHYLGKPMPIDDFKHLLMQDGSQYVNL